MSNKSNKYWIKGLLFLKLSWMTKKSKRIEYLSEYNNKLYSIIKSPLSDRMEGLIQLKNKLNAFDAFQNNTHWIISDSNDWIENMRLFDVTYEVMNYIESNIFEHCLDNWFENKTLKKELCSPNFLSSYTETIEILAYINNYKNYFEELNQKKSTIWDEIIVNHQ